ncbi:hypothetical protein E1B28_005496 [Marasmius oreades]|uniref:Uncharacterized protein n=1 Tax=Marasmius oreades TaxID=181124 RepID=A0A9P7S3A8_9AGAR|nr:uncharacterized protein E1B28_005496 [Marasmius oreades]KAG7094676.1 hypothetical protein E1B28_005496 [Marasmius oreades]
MLHCWVLFPHQELGVSEQYLDPFQRDPVTSNKGTALWFAIFDLEGGATNDIAMNATAYAHRDGLVCSASLCAPAFKFVDPSLPLFSSIETYAVGLLGVEDRTRQYLNDINNLIESSIPNDKLGAYTAYVEPYLKDGQR